MIINDNILYLIIKKLDTKTLFEVDKIEELKFITTPICQRRIETTKILQKFYRNQVKKYILKTRPQFWFNKDPTLALPLVRLPYHNTRINIEFRDFSELSNLS